MTAWRRTTEGTLPAPIVNWVVTGAALSGRHVLVVDDDRTVSGVVRRYLANAGFATDMLPDGAAW